MTTTSQARKTEILDTATYEALIEELRINSAIMAALEAAPPSEEELRLTRMYPRTPRQRILRMVAKQAGTAA